MVLQKFVLLSMTVFFLCSAQDCTDDKIKTVITGSPSGKILDIKSTLGELTCVVSNREIVNNSLVISRGETSWCAKMVDGNHYDDNADENCEGQKSGTVLVIDASSTDPNSITVTVFMRCPDNGPTEYVFSLAANEVLQNSINSAIENAENDGFFSKYGEYFGSAEALKNKATECSNNVM